MFCPSVKNYYLATYLLSALLSFLKICLLCIQFPFFSMKINSLAITYTVYELILTFAMLSFPYIPSNVQTMLSFGMIIAIQLPLRLSRHIIDYLLPVLVRPVTSTKSSSPERLILFTSLLNYYKSHIHAVKNDNCDVKSFDIQLLLILIGIMSKNSLPSCSVDCSLAV